MAVGEPAISVPEHPAISDRVEVTVEPAEAHRRGGRTKQVNDAAGTLASSAKVEFAGVAKSTW